MRDLISSGDLMRMFLEGDPNTIIRRPNVRRFAQENGVRHVICNGKWLIDYKEFFKKVNPRRIRRTSTMPRLRCLRDCVTEFNKNNRKYKIDKATVSHYMNSAQVTRYFHGNTWCINYDELEKVISYLTSKPSKKKEKKLQLNIENPVWHCLSNGLFLYIYFVIIT